MIGKTLKVAVEENTFKGKTKREMEQNKLVT